MADVPSGAPHAAGVERAITPGAVPVELGVALLAAVAATLWYFRVVFTSGFALMPGDLGDTRLLNYLLEHGWLWLHRDALHRDLWGLPMFYPAGSGAFAYSDLLLTFAPPYWVARACGAGAHTSFQIWLLTVGLLDALAAYALLRWGLGASRLGAILGANLATFAASRLYQIHHAQLWPIFYPLLALLAAAFHLRAQSPARARLALGAAGLAIVLQFYGGFYYGVFALLLAALLLVVGLCSRAARPLLVARLRRDAVPIVACAALAALLLAPLTLRYLHAQREVGARAWDEIEPLLPRLASWVYVAPSAPLAGWEERTALFTSLPHRDEHAVGLGFVTPLLMFCGLAAGWRRPAIRVATGAALIAMLAVTVYPGGFAPWRFAAQWVPGLSATRAMTRLGLVLPLLAAAAVSTLLDLAPRRARPWAVALVALALAEQSIRFNTFDKRVQERWVAAVASRVDPAASAFAVSSRRPGSSPWVVQLDAVWAGLATGRPTVNGYSGNWPPGWGGPLWTARSGRPEQRAEYAGALDTWLAAHGTPRAAVQWIELEPTYRRGRRFTAPPAPRRRP
jgi:hypothetical protein